MYLQSTDGLRPGDVLAKAVLDENARPLLRAGVVLDANLIHSLERRGCASVFQRDGLADDIEPAMLVEEQIRAEIAKNLAGTFEGITGDAITLTEQAPAASRRSRPTAPTRSSTPWTWRSSASCWACRWA